jgi:hypothetical protein
VGDRGSEKAEFEKVKEEAKQVVLGALIFMLFRKKSIQDYLKSLACTTVVVFTGMEVAKKFFRLQFSGSEIEIQTKFKSKA